MNQSLVVHHNSMAYHEQMMQAFGALDLDRARELVGNISRKDLHDIFSTCRTPEQRQFIWALKDLIDLTAFPSIVPISEIYRLTELHPEFREEGVENIRQRLITMGIAVSD